MASKKTTNQLANEIIKLFIDNDISLNQQLEILKLVRKKIEFCRSTGKKISQKELFD
jgi:hypothetical protein